jgi:hypothetical protein
MELFFQPTPQATALLTKISTASRKNLSGTGLYQMITNSEHCLTFDEDLLNDCERVAWIQERGGYPILNPKHNPFGHAVFWFANSRARQYAMITAEQYLTEPEDLDSSKFGFMQSLFRKR